MIQKTHGIIPDPNDTCIFAWAKQDTCIFLIQKMHTYHFSKCGKKIISFNIQKTHTLFLLRKICLFPIRKTHFTFLSWFTVCTLKVLHICEGEERGGGGKKMHRSSESVPNKFVSVSRWFEIGHYRKRATTGRASNVWDVQCYSFRRHVRHSSLSSPPPPPPRNKCDF